MCPYNSFFLVDVGRNRNEQIYSIVAACAQ